MDCTKSLELLSEYYEDTLDERVKLQVQAHLVSCMTCAVVMQDVEALVRLAPTMYAEETIMFPDEGVMWQRIYQAAH